MMDNSALYRVDVPLSERYETTCVECHFIKHFFGTAYEARQSALKMGWEFRKVSEFIKLMLGTNVVERAYCPHCKLLAKEGPQL